MKVTTEKNHLRGVRTDAALFLIFEETRGMQAEALKMTLGQSATPLRSRAFTGKAHETLVLYPESIPVRFLILVGTGKLSECTLEKLRRSAATGAKLARSLHAKRIAIIEPDPDALGRTPIAEEEHRWERIGTALAEGVMLGLYLFDRYITKKTDSQPAVRHLSLVTTSQQRFAEIARGASLGATLAEATCFARDLANAPGNELFPASLAEHARSVGRKRGIRVSVFDEKKIAALGMGGLAGVSRGSAKPPRFIVMEMNRRSKKGTVVLVGKGVTFDSGGISIKPSAGMAEMKMDMSGAAAVIGTMEAAARLRLPLHLVGLLPTTENLPGGSALKPGDILTHYNGKTTEVDNTDAEGRLILADALAYAVRFKPDLVIDLATLTGACVVALGHQASGMMGNDQRMMDRLREAGDRTFERVWQLPLYEEYEKLIKSEVADVKNVGGRWAGAITGAMFLRNFIGSYPWIHLDIAGPAMIEEATEYIPKGGSGVGVRLLMDFLRRWRKS